MVGLAAAEARRAAVARREAVLVRLGACPVAVRLCDGPAPWRARHANAVQRDVRYSGTAIAGSRSSAGTGAAWPRVSGTTPAQ